MNALLVERSQMGTMNDATLLALLALAQVGSGTDVYETVYHRPQLKEPPVEVVSPASTVRFLEERSLAESPYDDYEPPLAVVAKVHGRSRWVDLPIEYPDY